MWGDPSRYVDERGRGRGRRRRRDYPTRPFLRPTLLHFDGSIGYAHDTEGEDPDPNPDPPDIAPDMISTLAERHHQQIERAYKLGLLHGMNAQVMARIETEYLSFEDLGWSLEDDERK